MAADRQVIVDDTDPSINYTGSWNPDTFSTQESVGMTGPPYLHTLHSAASGGATAEFKFTGTAIFARGSFNVDNFANSTTFFKCFVDNARIDTPTITVVSGNNILFCEDPQLSDGAHTLRIEASAVTKGQEFWFDQLGYVPSPDSPLDNKTIRFDYTDPAIQFDPNVGGSLHDTPIMKQKNTTARVNFIGTSISWVASPRSGFPLVPATASWTIDDGQPIPFPVPAPLQNATDLFNQVYFTTPNVEAGPHILTVTFLGGDTTTPLGLDYLLVKNGSFPLHGSSGNYTKSAILGGILGGFAFFVFIVGAILFYLRCRRTRQKEGHNNVEGPSPIFVNPNGNNSSPSTHVRKPPLHSSGVSTSGEGPTPVTPTAQGEQPSATRKHQQRPAAEGTAPSPESNIGAGGMEHSNELPPPPPSTPPLSPLTPPLASVQEAVTTGANEVVRQHQDSGLRLNTLTVVDIPPQYTSF